MRDAPQGDERELAHLISLWQQGHRQGKPPEPAALCESHPELLAQLQARIAALQILEKLSDPAGQTKVGVEGSSRGAGDTAAKGGDPARNPGEPLGPVSGEASYEDPRLVHFREALKAGRKPPLEDYLGQAASATERSALLIALVRIALQSPAEASEEERLEEYREAYPELKDVPEAVLALTSPSPPLPAQLFSSPEPKPANKTLPSLHNKARGRGTDVVPMAGSYRLVKRLGEGALGEVWKAEAPGGVEVAVKRLLRTLSSHEAQGELRSLEHVKRLRHPNLVQIHAFWVHKSRLHLAMELADGNLLDRVAHYRKQGLPGIPQDELLRYVREAAAALDYLHGEGIHHRDIKPANLLLLKGCVKVADFGLARPLAGGDSQIQATFCGTPAFMAPEVWDNRLSTHSDQWSLALTYTELRLNRAVFKGGTLAALMTQIRSGQIDLTPLGKGEQQVLRRALHQDPHRRYPSCTAFAQALEAVLHPSPSSARRLVAPLLLLACLLAGVLLTLFILLRNGPAAVSLEQPPPLRVHTGGEASLDVRILHRHGSEPIELVAEGKPRDVEVETGPAQGDSIPVHVRVGAQTPPGSYALRLRPAQGPPVVTELPLTVLYVPPGFEPAEAATVIDVHGVEYYRMLRKVLDPQEAVELVLVPQEKTREEMPVGSDDLPTFYLGRDKITWGQLGAFVKQRPSALFPRKKVKDSFEERWKRHAREDRRIPAGDLRVEEAHAFADWLCRRVGRLPSVKQWNKAAGLYHPRGEQPQHPEGPYRGRWQDNPRPNVAVGRERPCCVGAATDDESVYHCRDMAGNGLEWTRDVRGDKTVPLPIVWGEATREVVSLRGCPFHADSPLTFDRMEDFIPEFYHNHSPDIGFRVVLEPPHGRPASEGRSP